MKCLNDTTFPTIHISCNHNHVTDFTKNILFLSPFLAVPYLTTYGKYGLIREQALRAQHSQSTSSWSTVRQTIARLLLRSVRGIKLGGRMRWGGPGSIATVVFVVVAAAVFLLRVANLRWDQWGRGDCRRHPEEEEESPEVRYAIQKVSYIIWDRIIASSCILRFKLCRFLCLCL